MRRKPRPENGTGDDPVRIRRRALDLLARREHGVEELRRKLLRKGHPAAQVEAVLAALLSEGLLSEARFVEGFVASRRARGEGPLRIRAALRQRGVEEALIEAGLAVDEAAWEAGLRKAWQKHFRGEWPRDPGERARQARFLLQRGFTMTQVMRFLGGDDGSP